MNININPGAITIDDRNGNLSVGSSIKVVSANIFDIPLEVNPYAGTSQYEWSQDYFLEDYVLGDYTIS